MRFSILQISKFLHINGHRKEVHCQQIDMLTRIISSEPTDHVSNLHVYAVLKSLRQNIAKMCVSM